MAGLLVLGVCCFDALSWLLFVCLVFLLDLLFWVYSFARFCLWGCYVVVKPLFWVWVFTLKLFGLLGGWAFTICLWLF